MVRGKFKLQQITQQANYPGSDLIFGAVSADGVPENERFHLYTPTGKLEMHVNNPAALAQCELGKEYYLDLTPA